MNRHSFLPFLAAALFAFPSLAAAQVPSSVTQQGRLLNSDGTPATSGVEVTFSIYDAATGGALIWEGTQTLDLDDTGFYSTMLGDASNPLDASVFGGGSAYITLSVAGGEEMTPRQQLTSVPYAVIAGMANTVADGSITSADLAPGFALDSTQVPATDWTDIVNVPADISDGDSDTLAGMSCAPGQVASWDGSNWACASVLTNSTPTLGGLSCAEGQLAKMIGGAWVCSADIDTDTNTDMLAGLNCTAGQVPKIVNGAWACGNDIDTDTDTDTTYTAGNQLALNGTTFNVQDGANSGLDADLLDGAQGSAYLRKSGGTMTGKLRTWGVRVAQSKLGAITTSNPVRSTARLEVVNSRRRETIAIPNAQFQELCGDSDGCTYTIGMRYWGSGTNQAMASRGPYRFDYTNSSGRWRASNFDKEGRDGDSAETHVQNIWDCCYFTEMQYISGVVQNDSTRQMYLLNWASSTCPLASNLECTIIFDD